MKIVVTISFNDYIFWGETIELHVSFKWEMIYRNRIYIHWWQRQNHDKYIYIFIWHKIAINNTQIQTKNRFKKHKKYLNKSNPTDPGVCRLGVDAFAVRLTNLSIGGWLGASAMINISLIRMFFSKYYDCLLPH